MGAPGKELNILIVAGEVSGDLHGSHLVRKLRELDPTLRFYGVGGDAMKAAGVELLAHISEMAVVGITEVLSKLRHIITVYRTLKASLESRSPNLVILIDYPDFNLLFARAVHRRHIPIAYYISPQVWAWRRGRIRAIARMVTKMIVIFPFERELYEHAGVDVAFVGHPLLDSVEPRSSRDETLRKLGLDPQAPTIGLLPGSRMSEIQLHLPILLESVPLISQEIDSVQFIVPVAPGLDMSTIRAMTQICQNRVRVVANSTYEIMQSADLILVASGTATMEAAIVGVPMIIIYRVSPITYFMGRLLIKTKNIGMVNIVAGKTIVPELIQGRCNPENVAAVVLQFMHDPSTLKKMKYDLRIVRDSLGDSGASQRAAEVIHNLLQENQAHASV